MILIKQTSLLLKLPDENVVVFTADGQYAPCRGCFACWLKNTGFCVMDDSLKHAGALIGQSDPLIIISRLCYGGYSPGVKAVFGPRYWSIPPLLYLAGRPNPSYRALPAAKTAAHSLLRRLYGIGTADRHELAERNRLNLGYEKRKRCFPKSCTDQGTIS